MERALSSVSSLYGYKPSEITAAHQKGGPHRLARARWHFWDMLHRNGWPYAEIARRLGLHHTSVIYGVRKHNEEKGREL
ncbi:hypothetical protein GTA62_14630 [Roseobacter sp. HKCCD9010]|uniref:terminase gpP N-terminus-related DNA-binding protein n=1 Tax=unclassified Roseobacter TaxID=196798 RepID=UPI0014930FA0|nr:MULTISPECIES: hypothetical protein [unclassified Roseobacter]MBF9050654.1 hypothetical protein [Rhodobacterales bacterium HKCCD4356]NNV11928.1 hypothetical protein [Roseobacter sp. HKCCD7357]NNV16941.1 hypothetical protein [Roseobacter sp. HKCCD8768]NNV26170.1 hypothetical protein [Roseobacter sp. HKCCD8192]NNV30664.1 hypothetical protein [Roseobacter sp. HKCCD9061]